MTAEHHFERRELNVRARTLLAADGTLSGPELRVGELSFQVGDEVIARVADRSLRADGTARGSYVRNGSLAGWLAFGRRASVSISNDGDTSRSHPRTSNRSSRQESLAVYSTPMR